MQVKANIFQEDIYYRPVAVWAAEAQLWKYVCIFMYTRFFKSIVWRINLKACGRVDRMNTNNISYSVRCVFLKNSPTHDFFDYSWGGPIRLNGTTQNYM